MPKEEGFSSINIDWQQQMPAEPHAAEGLPIVSSPVEPRPCIPDLADRQNELPITRHPLLSPVASLPPAEPARLKLDLIVSASQADAAPTEAQIPAPLETADEEAAEPSVEAKEVVAAGSVAPQLDPTPQEQVIPGTGDKVDLTEPRPVQTAEVARQEAALVQQPMTHQRTLDTGKKGFREFIMVDVVTPLQTQPAQAVHPQAVHHNDYVVSTAGNQPILERGSMNVIVQNDNVLSGMGDHTNSNLVSRSVLVGPGLTMPGSGVGLLGNDAVGQHNPYFNSQSVSIAPRVATLPESGELNNSIRESLTPESYESTHGLNKQPTEPDQKARPYKITETKGPLWWTEKVLQPIRVDAQPHPVDLDSLLVRALSHSAQIRVFSELPLIRDTAITEADAGFDWNTFSEAMWNDTSDPVGNTLTTGGASRFEDHNISAQTGLRRTNRLGGNIEVAQEFGHQNNNSIYFLPNNQGTARLRLSYTHPLLRGGGRVYNDSLIVLAQVDSRVAREELLRQVQGHLLEVTRAYWGLSLERAVYLQKVQSLTQATEVLENLQARQAIDTYRSQIVRAESIVASREAALIRAEVAMQNAEARIRALVNDPSLGNEESIEIIPTDIPIQEELVADLQETMAVAMQKRPEVLQAFRQIKAAAIRKQMTKNELLPSLNFVLSSYLSGLEGESNVTKAWANQFSTGQPSYGSGFEFSVPIANRAAKARHLRRKLEMRQFESQLRLTMETVNLEVGIAVRETNASHREMQAKYQAMVAASQDNEYARQRWTLLPGDNANASLVFDDLLRAQERLTDAENAYVKSLTTYNLSLTNLKKAAGILLETEEVGNSVINVEDVPSIIFEKYQDVGELQQPTDPLQVQPQIETLPHQTLPQPPATEAPQSEPTSQMPVLPSVIHQPTITADNAVSTDSINPPGQIR